MSNEQESAPQEEIERSQDSQARDRVSRELGELGIEQSEANIESALKQFNTPQAPAGFDDILDNIGNSEMLKEKMTQMNIKSIVHAEGKTVWDHAVLTMKKVDSLGSDIPDALKKDLKLLMFLHDLGKTVVWNNEQNIAQTQKKLGKGELHQSMIAHDSNGLDEIKSLFEANGVSGEKLETFMLTVRNHMQSSLPDQSPQKLVPIIESFGEDDDTRRSRLDLLTLVLKLDGEATQKITLDGGELKYSENEKKTRFDSEELWKKYEAGKALIADEKTKQAKNLADAQFEQQIFGSKMSDYLIQTRGINPKTDGQRIGKASGIIKGIIARGQSQGLTSQQIKEEIDKTEI